jgi:pre-mRNA-splicing helicase BRR2
MSGDGGRKKELSEFDYKAMSSLVIQQDRRGGPSRAEGTGEPESIKTHLHKMRMGERVVQSKPASSKKPAAGAGATAAGAGTGAGSRRHGARQQASALARAAAAGGPGSSARPGDTRAYYPRTPDTSRAYDTLLTLVAQCLGDQPDDVLHSAAESVVRALRDTAAEGGVSGRYAAAADILGLDPKATSSSSSSSSSAAAAASADKHDPTAILERSSRIAESLADFDAQIERRDRADASGVTDRADAAGGRDEEVAVVFDDDSGSEGRGSEDGYSSVGVVSDIDADSYYSSSDDGGGPGEGDAGGDVADAVAEGDDAAGGRVHRRKRRTVGGLETAANAAMAVDGRATGLATGGAGMDSRRYRGDDDGIGGGGGGAGGGGAGGGRRRRRRVGAGGSSSDEYSSGAGSGDDGDMRQQQQKQQKQQKQQAGGKHKRGVIPARDIDAFYVQRVFAPHFEETTEAAEAATRALEALMDAKLSERDCENTLVTILGYEAFDTVRLLLTNRARITWCIKLSRTGATGPERDAIEAEMATDPAGSKVLRDLRGDTEETGGADAGATAGASGAMDVDDESKPNASSNNNNAGGDGGGDDMDGVVDAAAAANSNNNNNKPAAAVASRRPRVMNLTAMAFAQGGHTMTNPSCDLPGSVLTQHKGYEEVRVPAATPPEGAAQERLISVADEVPAWARPAFKGIEKLNRIQSRTYEYALFSADNMLLCAPTGAGKTNVAMLTMLGEIGRHMGPGGRVDTSKFKIVYVAPMKALVQEMVAGFGRRLAPFGISVRELTGDMSLTRQEISATQVIVTTPEKWDIVTRKNGDRTYTALVNLVIIDEIHLLHDARGPVLESLVARTIRGVESSGRMVRLVGLSATLPNPEDVRLLLRVPDGGLFRFGPEYRPVPLEQFLIGITERSPLKRHRLTNDICYSRVAARAGESQVLVFVHSRKETAKTARYLRDRSVDEGKAAAFIIDQTSRRALDAAASQAQSTELKDLLPYGFGIHHAGMVRADRTLVEELYASRHVQVLVSTATLAWGVNLPAHEVIIKGTQVYDPSLGRWGELSFLDIMQMIGRAGRPGFDTHGTGVIITGHAELQYYLSLFNAQLPIESQMIARLPDQLNAEVVLGTVATIDDAAEWLGYTYLYVRAMRHPRLYGADASAIDDDPDLLQFRRDLAHSACVELEASGLVRYDRRGGRIAPRDPGRISSHYYVGHASMREYRRALREPMGLIDLLGVFSRSSEFSNIRVKPEERVELERLAERIPVPFREGASEGAAKVNVLLQAHVSRLPMEGLTLGADMVYVKQSAARLLRALWELIVREGWATLARHCLDLCRSLERGQWTSMSPLRQFPDALPEPVLRRLERRGASTHLTGTLLRESTPAELGELVRAPELGKDIHALALRLPQLHLKCSVQPLTPSLLNVDLHVTPDFAYDHRHHPGSMRFWIIAHDVDESRILHREPLVITAATATATHDVSFTIPVPSPPPPLFFVTAMPDTFLACDALLPVSLRHLVLPAPFAPPTPVPDVAGATVPCAGSESITLTPELTVALAALRAAPGTSGTGTGTGNVLLCLAASRGRSLAAMLAVEAAIERRRNGDAALASSSSSGPVAVCVTAMRETAARRAAALRAAGHEVVLLAGRQAEDVRAVVRAGSGKVVVACAADWEAVSRRWQHRRVIRELGLIVVEDIQLVGRGLEGATLEIVVSRARYASPDARIVAIGGPVANATDVAEWIGAPPASTYAFAAPPAAEIVVKGFDIDHAQTRVEAMLNELAKPWVSGSVGGDNDVLVFAPTRATADRVNSGALDGMVNSPRLDAFRAVVDPWGQDVDDDGDANNNNNNGSKNRDPERHADTVIILDTRRYDGRERRYVELPMSDILEMAGRARRRCIVLCHSRRKEHLKRFMRDPLPVESHVDHYLADFLNAEISAGNVETRQEAVDYLTWTLLYRRLTRNPNYYNLTGVTHRHLSDHLSGVVEGALTELVNASCIVMKRAGDKVAGGGDAVAAGGELSPGNLGLIAAFYNIGFDAAELIDSSLSASAGLAGILEVVSAAASRGLPVRRGESLAIAKLAAQVPLGTGAGGGGGSSAGARALADLSSKDPAHAKALVLLQAHFSRLPLPEGLDLARDARALAERVREVFVPAVVDIASSRGWYRPVLEAMELSQMCACGMWADEPPMWQLPHANAALVAAAGPTTGVLDVLDLEDDERARVLEGLSVQQVADIANYCNTFPNPELVHSAKVAADGALEIEATVRDDDDEEEDEPGAAAAKGPVRARWYVVVGVASANALVAIKACETGRTVSLRVEPSRRVGGADGRYTVALVARDFIGADQAYEFADPDPEGAATGAGAAADEDEYESYSEDEAPGQQQAMQE